MKQTNWNQSMAKCWRMTNEIQLENNGTWFNKSFDIFIKIHSFWMDEIGHSSTHLFPSCFFSVPTSYFVNNKNKYKKMGLGNLNLNLNLIIIFETKLLILCGHFSAELNFGLLPIYFLLRDLVGWRCLSSTSSSFWLDGLMDWMMSTFI